VWALGRRRNERLNLLAGGIVIPMGVQVEFAAMLISQAVPLIIAVASLLCFLAVVADASRP